MMFDSLLTVPIWVPLAIVAASLTAVFALTRRKGPAVDSAKGRTIIIILRLPN
jgi:hypothetical protein